MPTYPPTSRPCSGILDTACTSIASTSTRHSSSNSVGCWATRTHRTGIGQALAYVSMLQDPETGLFHHFWLERTGRPYALGWSRGQGWALLGLLDVLRRYPQTGIRVGPPSLQATRALADAMVRCQRPGGDWDAVAHAPESGTEASTAAFMAAGLRRGVDEGGSIRKPPAGGRGGVACDDSHASTSVGMLRDVSAAVWSSTAAATTTMSPRASRYRGARGRSWSPRRTGRPEQGGTSAGARRPSMTTPLRGRSQASSRSCRSHSRTLPANPSSSRADGARGAPRAGRRCRAGRARSGLGVMGADGELSATSGGDRGCGARRTCTPDRRHRRGDHDRRRPSSSSSESGR